MEPKEDRIVCTIVALLFPFISCWVQWHFWPVFKPFVWFLFFPTVFFSSRIGGKIVGIISTLISALLAVYFFIPPQLSFSGKAVNNLYSVGTFLIMGVLFSLTHDNLEKAKRRAAEALKEIGITNQRLQESNEQVTQLYQKTLRLDELKTRFFANVSHELRTPLTLVLGPVARCLADSGLNNENRRNLEVVERNARMLYRQVSDLLDAAKLEAGGMSLRYSAVELAGLVRFVASHFESRAEENSIIFLVDTPDTLWVQADPEKCRRILLNLLANAFKFTQAGGRISTTLRECDGLAVMEVSDNGPGIPADMRGMVFERFSQVDGGNERRFGGTGLGLAIVKEFVELHGGNVAVTEAVEGGARFTATLPLAAPDNTIIHAADEGYDEHFLHMIPDGAPPRTDGNNPMISSNAPLILVVEDNPDMNRYITSLFGRQYRVASAFDGEEGLVMACSLQPDLLISDMMMPRMSGERMVLALRSYSGMNSLPIIMLSAKADEELRVRLLENGVQDFLTKPFSDAELLARAGVLLAERKRTSGELQKSEERFRLLFTYAPLPLCYVTSAGVLADRNKRFVQTFGYTYDDVPTLDEWWQSAYPDADYRAWALKIWNTAVAKAAATGSDIDPVEYNLTCKDGTIRTVLISGITLGDDLLATFFDVTERKKTEEALRKSEASLQQAQRLAKVGNWSWDIERGLHTWSEEIYRIYDRDSALPPAVYPEVETYFTPESWVHLSRAVENGLTRGEAYACDAEVVRSDGRPCWIVARGNAERDSAGTVVKLYGTVQEITERKLAEEEIRRLNAGLEQRVEERTAELLSANRELDAFAYAVSHDLRAPLRAMNGFSQALIEDYGAQLQGEAHSYLEQITFASRHMGELIDGLLTLSRSTRGELCRDVLNLSRTAGHIRDEFTLQEPGRPVNWQIEPDMTVRGDARMLELVMRNLIGNAWKYSAAALAPQIRVYTEVCNGIKYYCISDNGAGFDMRHAERLFKPFQRLHRQDEFPGIGIGLATVQRIIHRHGGEVSAEAEPGKGAIFRFTLSDHGVT